MMGNAPSSPDLPSGAAPADTRLHAPWPAWKKLLAYAVLTALAAASIWYIDLKAHRPDGGAPRANPSPAARV